MVVDNQHSRAHTPIVPDATRGHIAASTNPFPATSVQALTQDSGLP
jgi:hypothetical protein